MYMKLAAGCRSKTSRKQWVAGSRLPIQLPVSDSKHKVSSGLPVAYIVCFESELPIRWTCLFRIGNWIGNRQLVTSCRFVELILSVPNLNRQQATCRLPIRWTCLFRIGNWIGNLQLDAICRFVELILSVSNLNCWLPIRWNCLFRIGSWIGNWQFVADSLNLYCLFRGNRQLNRQPATHC